MSGNAWCRRLVSFILVGTAPVMVAACSSEGGGGASSTTVPAETAPTRRDLELEQTMQGILDAHRANDEFVGAVLSLREADGTGLTVTSGTKGPSGDGGAVDPDIPWGVGSATKVFVAVVVLQLAEEGRIDLDDGIERYVPDLPGADRITPRQLLQHTSGLGEYLQSPAVQADAGREWSPAELVAAAEALGRTGEPGGSYHYSNTGYVVLGEIIEQVTGSSWFDEVRTRILEPLLMRKTRLVGTVKDAPGYGIEDGTFVEYTNRRHPSLGGAAGGLASTASDLLELVEALATGKLLSDRSQAEMATFVPGEDLSDYGVVQEYGLGLEKYATGQLTVYGHMGNTAAHGSFMGFDDASGAAVVVMMNTANPGRQAVMAIEALTAVST